jgi:hypothetical protein
MFTDVEHPTAGCVEMVADQTLKGLQEKPRFWTVLRRNPPPFHRSLAELVELASRVDPAAFSEADFAALDEHLTRVIDALAQYFAKHVSQDEVAECWFLGNALKSLKDSRHWIVQGLSPDPTKRPTVAERRERAEKHASNQLADLFA